VDATGAKESPGTVTFLTYQMIAGPFFILFILLFFVSIGGLVVFILHLVTMSAALNAIPQPLRKIPPGNVWLILVPFFGIVYQFIVIGAVSDSIKAEFMRRNVPRDEDRPGYNTGLTAAILFVCGIIPWLGIIISLIGIIFLLIHMNRIKAYTRYFEQNPYPFLQQHMAFAFNQPVYNPQQQYQQHYQQPYNPQQQYQRQYQQPYNPQQQYQQPYNAQQQYQQPPVAPPQNDQSKYMPPAPPPANDNNPWAPKSDNPPPPAQ
jgi:hypothetical protein